MSSRSNTMPFLDDQEEGQKASWCNNGGLEINKEEFQMGSLSTFKSMLDQGDDLYLTTASMHGSHSFSSSFTEVADNNNQLVFQPLDLSSTSCSPKPSSVLNNLDPSHTCFVTPNSLTQNPHEGGFNLSSVNGGLGFVEGNNLFFNRSNKILKPLDIFASIGEQPTLFQKRVALRKINDLGGDDQIYNENKIKKNNGDDLEDVSVDGYESDDQESGGKINGGSSSTVTGGSGGRKGKTKGFPAKNLMAERRRRKKLNDRMFMLRSVVPKISKMDRTSILGDAVEYLKELLRKIDDLQSELESTSSSSTPTFPGPSTCIKEERCPSAFASPLSSPTAQSARVEVKLQEDKAVNIHMFCGSKPGRLLSIMRTIDNLGLDVQQAVISCFNGLAVDIFRAEWEEGQELHPAHIKAMLLNSAGFHGIV